MSRGSEETHLETEGDLLQLTSHAVELLDVSECRLRRLIGCGSMSQGR